MTKTSSLHTGTYVTASYLADMAISHSYPCMLTALWRSRSANASGSRAATLGAHRNRSSADGTMRPGPLRVSGAMHFNLQLQCSNPRHATTRKSPSRVVLRESAAVPGKKQFFIAPEAEPRRLSHVLRTVSSDPLHAKQECSAPARSEKPLDRPRRCARRYSGLDGRSALRGHAKTGRGLNKGAHHACWRRKTEATKSSTRKTLPLLPVGKSQTRVGSRALHDITCLGFIIRYFRPLLLL